MEMHHDLLVSSNVMKLAGSRQGKLGEASFCGGTLAKDLASGPSSRPPAAPGARYNLLRPNFVSAPCPKNRSPVERFRMVKSSTNPPQSNGHTAGGEEPSADKAVHEQPPAQEDGKPAAAGPATDPPVSANPATADPPTTTPSKLTDEERLGKQTPATESKPVASGKLLRGSTPRSCHAESAPPADRRDPVEIIIESSVDRVPICCRFVTAGCKSRRSRFIAERRRSWRPIWRHADDRPAGATVWRLSLAELWRVCHARAEFDFRRERFRRDVARPVGMGPETPGGEFRDRGRHNNFRAGESRAAVLAMVREVIGSR